MTLRDYILLGVVFVTAAGLYLWKGNPGIAEQPFADRAAEISAADPATLSPEELLTRLQAVAQDRPQDPVPHYHIGVLLRSTGRSDDASRAFQSALRRDDRHVPSLVALGDLLTVESGGQIGDMSARVYERAWRLDNSQVRAGFLAGLAAYRAGRVDEAEARWAAIDDGLAEEDPKRGMLVALISSVSEIEDSALDSP